MRLSQYFHTIRYLRPVQVYDRVWFALKQPKPDMSPPPSLRLMAGKWRDPARREPSMLGSSRFRFLNKEHEVNSPSDWNNYALEKLWLYNLHYFDDLNAREADRRRHWHRALLDRWIKENPPLKGLGWAPYPLSLRIVNWIKWALTGNRLPDRTLASLAVQVRHLSKRLERHLLGNHLFANAKALVFAGLFFNGSEAAKWLAEGLKVLSQEIPEQILTDGGHFERSPMYHSLVLEDLLDLYNIAQVYPEAFSPAWTAFVNSWPSTIQKMRNWLKAMCHPDGEIALFNDAAWGIAPSPSELEAYASCLGIESVSPLEEGITHLAATGYIRLQKGDAVAILDVGDIGPDYLPGHAHADTLTFELSLFGSRVIVNSGTSTYEFGEERQHQRSTAAHNTVVVDDTNSSEVWSNFRVARRAIPNQLKITDQGDQGFWVECSHNGYKRLPGRALHTRSWRLKDQQLEIIDIINGTVSSAVARFHFHPDVMPVEVTSERMEKMSFRGGHPFSWSSNRAIGILEKTTFHPRFGLSFDNFCLAARIDNNRAAHRFAWA